MLAEIVAFVWDGVFLLGAALGTRNCCMAVAGMAGWGVGVIGSLLGDGCSSEVVGSDRNEALAGSSAVGALLWRI